MMSSFFDGTTVSTKPIKTAKFGCIIGKPDSGKSFLASFAPKPFFLATEKGAELVKNDVGRFETADERGNTRLRLPTDVDEFFEAWKMIVKNKGSVKGIQYETIVVDGAKFTQQLFDNDTLKKNPSRTENNVTKPNTSAHEIPFGVAVKNAIPFWEKFLYGVEELNNAGIQVILISHTFEKAEDQPDGSRPKRTIMDLPSWGEFSVRGIVMAKADYVYHMRKEIKTRVIANNFGGKGKVMPIDGGKPDVVVWTRATNMLDAKCKTLNYEDIPDCYVIDINNDDTSRVIFQDLARDAITEVNT